jgi:small subunit ribosomal protein S20
VFNIRRKNTMKDVMKDVDKAVLAGDAVKAKELLPKAYQAIDKAAKRGVIKDNTADRKKSRLTARVKAVK